VFDIYKTRKLIITAQPEFCHCCAAILSLTSHSTFW